MVDLAGSHSLSGSSSLVGGAADIGSDEALRQQVSSVSVSLLDNLANKNSCLAVLCFKQAQTIIAQQDLPWWEPPKAWAARLRLLCP